MRRVAVLTTLLLLMAACGDDDDGGSGSSLDLAGAAAGAQRAIDQGDGLGNCPWDQQAVVAAVGAVVELVPEFAGFDDDYGQVFSGGEVDITYCDFWVGSPSTPTGIEEFRIDAHPGTADLQQYLDEEWGGEPDEATTSDLSGGTVRAWCLEENQCIAAWQGDGLFVALVIHGVATATADDAVTALKAALPIVVSGLAAT